MCGCGDPTLAHLLACPAECRAPLGWRKVASGGLPLTIVGGFRCQALSLARLPVFEAGYRAPLPVFLGGGGAGMGTDHRPHSVRSCVRALRAVGVAGGLSGGGGGASRACEGHLELGAVPSPAAGPWGRQPGPAAHSLWARACGCGDPALAPWRVCSAGCHAPRGWREAAPGGVPLTVVRSIWCQALPSSRLPVLWRGSQARSPVFVGGGWCGRGDRAPSPKRALLGAVGVARGGPWGGMPRAVVRGVCG